jgi:hypothetical protein
MKFKYHLLFFNSILITTLLFSCKKFDDRHRQFFENGETIYIAKADSIKLQGGNGRIGLSWLLLSDPKISKYKVYWNSRRDSIEGSVQKTENVDTVRAIINNIKEGTYQFEIYNYDKNGNRSIPSIRIGRSYGTRFQQSLLPRVYKSFKRIGNDLEFIWVAGSDNLKHLEVKYVNTLGEAIQVFIPKKTEFHTLLNFPVGGTMEFRSVYLPEPDALDTFVTPYAIFKE